MENNGNMLGKKTIETKNFDKNTIREVLANSHNQINEAIKELSDGNYQSALEISRMAGSINEIYNFIDNLVSSLENIEGKINLIKKNDDAIIAVTNKTTIISLNASIEAAHLGQHGKVFSVIATELKKISDKTQELAKKSNSDSQLIDSAIDLIIDKANHLKKTVGIFKDELEVIAANSEEISAQTDSISQVSHQLKDKLEAIDEKNKANENNTEEFKNNDKINEVLMNGQHQISETIKELAAGNYQSAQEISKMAESIHEIYNFIDDLMVSIKDVEGNINLIKDNDDAIIEIAAETNMVSINASIEAAHLGEKGIGFTVIANEIKELSKNTKELAKKSDSDSKIIIPEIKNIINNVSQLKIIVETFKDELETVAATSEEISAQTDSISEALSHIKIKEIKK